MNKCAVGIDIGGTTIKMGFTNLKGEIIDKWEIKTNREDNGKYIIKDIANSLLEQMEKLNINYDQIEGIGLGVPGPVTNNIVLSCANLGWKNYDVIAEFEKLIPFKTKIIASNDANVAAYAELVMSDQPKKNAVMITLGTGVGGGIIVDKKVVDGLNGAGGEFGHFGIDNVYNFKCNCGRTGCLETVTSATGIVNLAKYYLGSSESKLNKLDDFNCKDVFDLAQQNDPVCLKAVNEFGHYMGLATAFISSVLDPDCFYIGGGVSKAGNYLIEIVEKYYQKYAVAATKNTKFYIAKLGNDSGIVGAAMLSQA